MPDISKRRPKGRTDDHDGRPSLAELVYQQLSRAIGEGRYHPGERIRETVVSKEYDVSRTPVREALRRLQSEGRIVFEPQRGAVVAELDRQEVVEIYVLRQHLEGIAARFAAQHASDAEIAQLEDILERGRAVEGDMRELNQINWEFHNAIATAGHNRFLLRSFAAIADALALLRGAKYIPAGRAKTLHVEHARILDAIRARDPDEADGAAQDHVAHAFRNHLSTALDDHRARVGGARSDASGERLPTDVGDCSEQ